MAKINILNLINNLFEIANKSNWTKAYNKQLDYFYWVKPSLSRNVRLVKISREVLLYINPKGLIEGIGVEYLKNNFIKHNPEYKDLPELFTEKIDETILTTPKEKEGLVGERFESFAKDLASDIKEESFEHNLTAKDLESLVGAAIEN